MEVTNRGKLYSKYRNQIFKGAYKSEYSLSSNYKPRHLSKELVDESDRIISSMSILDEKSAKYNMLYKDNFKNKQTLMYLIIFALSACFVVIGIFLYR